MNFFLSAIALHLRRKSAGVGFSPLQPHHDYDRAKARGTKIDLNVCFFKAGLVIDWQRVHTTYDLRRRWKKQRIDDLQ